MEPSGPGEDDIPPPPLPPIDNAKSVYMHHSTHRHSKLLQTLFPIFSPNKRYQNCLQQLQGKTKKQLRHHFVDGCLRRDLSYEELKAMVDLGVDPNTRIKSSYGRNALGSAASGSLDFVRFLVEELHCKITITNALGYTVLHQGCTSGGKLEIVKYLVDRCGHNIHLKDFLGNTPLHNASSFEDCTPIVDFLLSKGADATATNKSRWTPLHCACLHNSSVETVRLLIRAGTKKSINQPDKFSRTPVAFCRTLPEVVEILFQSGADPNFCINGAFPAFHEALRSFDSITPAVAMTWLKCGMDPNLRESRNDVTALHALTLYTKHNQAACVEKILELGADPTVHAKTKGLVKILRSNRVAIPTKIKHMSVLHTVLLMDSTAMLDILLADERVRQMIKKPDLNGLGWIEFAQNYARGNGVEKLAAAGAI
jgi:ankyrin repeat protein